MPPKIKQKLLTAKELIFGNVYHLINGQGTRTTFPFCISIGTFIGYTSCGWPKFSLGLGKECAMNHGVFEIVHSNNTTPNRQTKKEIQDKLVTVALSECNGNRKLAAKMLNMPERSLYRIIQERKENKNGFS